MLDAAEPLVQAPRRRISGLEDLPGARLVRPAGDRNDLDPLRVSVLDHPENERSPPHVGDDVTRERRDRGRYEGCVRRRQSSCRRQLSTLVTGGDHVDVTVDRDTNLAANQGAPVPAPPLALR